MNKIKQFFRKVASYFPTQLPIGVTDFHSWADDIVQLSGAPDNDSSRYTLGLMLPQLAPNVDRKSKNHFVKCIRKAMANQVASQVAWDIKQAAAAKAAEANKSAEVTASTPGLTSDATQ